MRALELKVLDCGQEGFRFLGVDPMAAIRDDLMLGTRKEVGDLAQMSRLNIPGLGAFDKEGWPLVWGVEGGKVDQIGLRAFHGLEVAAPSPVIGVSL